MSKHPMAHFESVGQMKNQLKKKGTEEKNNSFQKTRGSKKFGIARN